MRRLRRTWHRLLGFVRRGPRDADFAAEIDSHVALHAAELVRRGVTPDEARRLALMRLGGVEAVKEAHRDQRGLPIVDTIVRDVRYTGRLVRRQPAFYLALVLILAGTLGLCAVIFSVVHAILLRPLPYADVDRLVRVHELNPSGGTFAAAPANAVSWRDDTQGTFDGLALFRARTYEMSGAGTHGGDATTLAHAAAGRAEGGDVARVTAGGTGTAFPERLEGVRVSANLFDVLGVQPLIGRTFVRGEDAPGRNAVVVISHGLWRRAFAGRLDVVGQSIRVDGTPHLVVGVLPADFEFPAARSEFAGGVVDMIAPQDWTPDDWADRGDHSWRVIGRLAPGVTLAQARQVLTTLGAHLARTYETNRNWGVFAEPLEASIFGATTRVLWMLAAGVGALLLIGCANVANLLLARGIARRGEFVIRTAIGGSASRLIGQVLTESLLVAGLGAVLGLAFADVGLRLFLALAPKDLPRIEHIAIGGTSIAATTIVAVVAALLFGLLPAWRAGRTQPADVLRAGGRGTVAGTSARVQAALVIGQVAITVVLLVCAGLLLRTAMALQRTPLGLDPDQVITVRLSLGGNRYPGQDGMWRFLSAALDRVRALPGVQNVAAVSHPPLVWGDSMFGFAVEGDEQATGAAGSAIRSMKAGALRYSISPEYFETLGIPIVAGRAFTDRDRREAPQVVIVNEFLARKHLGRRGQSPIGAHLAISGVGRVEVVGVVRDTRHYGVDVPVQEQFYLPYAQYPSGLTTIAVKTPLAAESIVPAIRQTVSALDPTQPVSHIVPMTEAVGAKLARPRLSAALLATFAVFALALAAAGLFAVISYVVGRRTAEMGLRLALGAQRRQVVSLVLMRGVRMALVGLCLGVALAWPVALWVRTLLVGVEPHDPWTFAGVVAIVASTALIACIGPARRALRVEPVMALRAE